MPSWSRGCMGLRMRLARETGDAATPAVSIPTAADCHYVVKVKSAVGHCYSGPAPPPPSSLCTRSAMNCMLWPPVEWKMSLHLSKSLAFAHCPIKFAASTLVSFPDLVIFLARRTLRIRNTIFFVQVIHSCRPGYIHHHHHYCVQLTLGNVPKSNLILNWQSEADTQPICWLI